MDTQDQSIHVYRANFADIQSILAYAQDSIELPSLSDSQWRLLIHYNWVHLAKRRNPDTICGIAITTRCENPSCCLLFLLTGDSERTFRLLLKTSANIANDLEKDLLFPVLEEGNNIVRICEEENFTRKYAPDGLLAENQASVIMRHRWLASSMNQ